MKSLCENIYTIVKKLFSILNLDYKQNITIIQFTVDLIWNLNDVNYGTNTELERDGLILKAFTSIITVFFLLCYRFIFIFNKFLIYKSLWMN
jgi:hypothetical protein